MDKIEILREVCEIVEQFPNARFFGGIVRDKISTFRNYNELFHFNDIDIIVDNNDDFIHLSSKLDHITSFARKTGHDYQADFSAHTKHRIGDTYIDIVFATPEQQKKNIDYDVNSLKCNAAFLMPQHFNGKVLLETCLENKSVNEICDAIAKKVATAEQPLTSSYRREKIIGKGYKVTEWSEQNENTSGPSLADQLKRDLEEAKQRERELMKMNEQEKEACKAAAPVTKSFSDLIKSVLQDQREEEEDDRALNERAMDDAPAEESSGEQTVLTRPISASVKAAAYRVASKQTVNVVRNALIVNITKLDSNNRMAFCDLLRSDGGEAVISWIIGMLIPNIPTLKENKIATSLAEEMRIEGLAIVGNAVFENLFKSLVPLLTENLSAIRIAEASVLQQEQEEESVPAQAAIVAL